MSPRLTEIVARDGAACVWCGRHPWVRDLTLEHVLPRSRLTSSPRPAQRFYGARQLDLLRRLEAAPGRRVEAAPQTR